jgi:hypothetical protein
MHIANRCAPQNIADGAENLVLQALQFQQMVFAANHHLLNVLLQIANKLGLSKKKNLSL